MIYQKKIQKAQINVLESMKVKKYQKPPTIYYIKTKNYCLKSIFIAIGRSRSVPNSYHPICIHGVTDYNKMRKELSEISSKEQYTTRSCKS